MPRSATAAVLLLLATACVYCLTVVGSVTAVGSGATPSVLSFGVTTPRRKLITTSSKAILHSRRLLDLTSILRGGASIATDDEDEEDEESEYDEEDEEDESIVTPHSSSATPSSKSTSAAATKNKVTLVTSTKKLIQKKHTTEMKSQIKKAVSASLSKSSMKRKSGINSLYKHYVPYIIRATINPFTLWTMTKAYFISLCDINYGKEVSVSVVLLL
jgi:hypothetical protein